MDKATEIMQAKQKNRVNVLIYLYENGATSLSNTLSFSEVTKKLGIDKGEASEILVQVGSEGGNWVKWYGSGNVHLTTGGISYVERIISTINQPKEQPIAPIPTVHNYHSPVGAVQTGNYNTATVTQNIGTHTMELLKLINELRQSFQNLPNEQKQEATELVDGIEQEIKSEKPRKANIKALLGSAKDFALDTVQKVLIETISKAINNQP